MNQRIANRFASLKREKRAGLVTFTMAYDPDYATSTEILCSLPGKGADIVELGMPFSDPMADGPTIQEAGIRALKAGATMEGIFSMVTAFRKQHADTPLILMGYYNPIHHYGLEAFCHKAHLAGVDGFIVVDLPPEEDTEFFTLCQATHLSLIKLLTPTTTLSRLKTILPKASGFLYYVAVAGVTGTTSATPASIQKALHTFRQHTSLPIVVGFGIKDPESARKIAPYADAVVVGSSLVATIPYGKDTLLEKVSLLSQALHTGNRSDH